MGREREGLKGLEAELRALGAFGERGRSPAEGGAGSSGGAGAGSPGGGAAGAGAAAGGEAGSPAGVSGGTGVSGGAAVSGGTEVSGGTGVSDGTGVDVEAVVAGVMGRVAGEPVPVAGWRVRLRRRVWARRRVLLAGLAAVLAGLLLAPPVRAGVASLFDFGGVAVRVTPSATPSGPGAPGAGAPPPDAVGDCGALSLDAAARRAGFRPPVPRGLGPPDAAGVSADGRMVSLCWSGGGRGAGSGGGGDVRLDAFRGTLDPLVGKTSSVPPEWEQVNTGTALWFPEPHRLELLLHEPGGGGTYEHSVRTAGPTLLWQGPDALTLRLEGVPGKPRALRIADSAS